MTRGSTELNASLPAYLSHACGIQCKMKSIMYHISSVVKWSSVIITIWKYSSDFLRKINTSKYSLTLNATHTDMYESSKMICLTGFHCCAICLLEIISDLQGVSRAENML